MKDKTEEPKESELEKKLTYKPKNLWAEADENLKKQISDFCEPYKAFLNNAKTEREAVATLKKLSLEKGFEEFCNIPEGKSGPGAKFFATHKDKNIAIVRRGMRPLTEGLLIIASHIDSPRLDLKQNPLYEDLDLALLKTHYYGGIKKYQWGSIQLALHGVALTERGKVQICIGEKDDDPVFTIPDLLPHLGKKAQYERKTGEVLKGEELRILCGGMPINDEKAKQKVKLNVLKYLNDNYGLVERDLLSAEICAVPIQKARDLGFHRSLVGSYGQDDRVCAYACARAIFDMQIVPDHTCIALMIDKEEIGSEGNTSINSPFLEELVLDMCKKSAYRADYHTLIKILKNSKALSSDVNAGINPNFQGVHEKQNAAKLHYGICLTKFTGAGGKYMSNDANAEYMSGLIRLFEKEGVCYQVAELGKVDEGGGGTIAKYLAKRGPETIDIGVPLLNMHSPCEVASKADIWSAYAAYRAFFDKL